MARDLKKEVESKNVLRRVDALFRTFQILMIKQDDEVSALISSKDILLNRVLNYTVDNVNIVSMIIGTFLTRKISFEETTQTYFKNLGIELTEEELIEGWDVFNQEIQYILTDSADNRFYGISKKTLEMIFKKL